MKKYPFTNISPLLLGCPHFKGALAAEDADIQEGSVSTNPDQSINLVSVGSDASEADFFKDFMKDWDAQACQSQRA